MIEYCKKRFQIGDRIADRFGHAVCGECDDKYPAPIMAVYTAGIVNGHTLEIFPTLKCGDIIIGKREA